MAARTRKAFSKYMVADPVICRGDLTFTGTRLPVKDVLYYAGQGKGLVCIPAYRNSISLEAIRTAINQKGVTATCRSKVGGMICRARLEH